MKLKTTIYTIVNNEQTDKGTDYNISLIPDCIIYKAHFPEQPITPGVCIIQIAKELLEETTGKSLTIKVVKNVKFLRVISPIETSEVCYSLQNIIEEGDSIKVQVQVKSGNDIYAKISFVCQIAA